MLLPQLSLCLLLAATLPKSSMVEAQMTNQSRADYAPPIRQHWHVSNGHNGNPADLSIGATWSFIINAFGSNRLDIDFAVAPHLTGDAPCSGCSALNIVFLFDQRIIHISSRRHGVWDFSERRTNPIQNWQKFTLDVKLVEDGFKITIDGYWTAMWYNRLFVGHISEVTSQAADAYVQMDYWQKAVADYDYDVKEQQITQYQDQIAAYQATLAEYENTLAGYRKMLKKYEDALSQVQVMPRVTVANEHEALAPADIDAPSPSQTTPDSTEEQKRVVLWRRFEERRRYLFDRVAGKREAKEQISDENALSQEVEKELHTKPSGTENSESDDVAFETKKEEMQVIDGSDVKGLVRK